MVEGAIAPVTVTVPTAEAPTEDEVPECIDAIKYLKAINDTTISNSEASDLLLNSFQTKIDSSTSVLSTKADQSLQNITSLSQLTSNVKTCVQQIETTVDESAKEISSLNAKVDAIEALNSNIEQAIDALSNRTTAIEDATGQLAGIVHALVTQQREILSSFTELREDVKEIKKSP